jgi:hypothetical protein
MHRVAFLGQAACAFVAAYTFQLGALLYANFGLFTSPGRRLDQWQTYWGAYVILCRQDARSEASSASGLMSRN